MSLASEVLKNLKNENITTKGIRLAISNPSVELLTAAKKVIEANMNFEIALGASQSLTPEMEKLIDDEYSFRVRQIVGKNIIIVAEKFI